MDGPWNLSPRPGDTIVVADALGEFFDEGHKIVCHIVQLRLLDRQVVVLDFEVLARHRTLLLFLVESLQETSLVSETDLLLFDGILHNLGGCLYIAKLFFLVLQLGIEHIKRLLGRCLLLANLGRLYLNYFRLGFLVFVHSLHIVELLLLDLLEGKSMPESDCVSLKFHLLHLALAISNFFYLVEPRGNALNLRF